MDTIKEVCSEIFRLYSTDISKDDILKNCARKKLIKIYDSENYEFECLINKLETSVDYNDYTGVKKCVTKLLKLLNMNRKTLILSLERLCR